jgi:hypothetical protein
MKRQPISDSLLPVYQVLASAASIFVSMISGRVVSMRIVALVFV